MKGLLGGMTTARFLRDHWQKKPLLVRGAFPRLRDPLTPDELAGLACEDGVESRIVREAGGSRPWEVTYGPQDEGTFASLPDRGWTVLVQELNRHVPAAALLLEPFAFVPNVRVDDVMVSFAAPGGSVGPHVDSYDVFLIQGRGERRWMYGTRPLEDARLVPDVELRILESFTPDADEVLGPGDMLYLPPRFAHHGVALSPCLTYSVGFRSPSAGEMWMDFAQHVARSADGARLLVDPPLTPAREPGAIPGAMLERVRAAVRGIDLSDDAIDRWFASFATRLKPGHELSAPRRAPDERALMERLRRGDLVARSEEGRWAHLPRRGGGLFLYVGGRELEVGRSAAPVARLLSSRRRFEGDAVAALAKDRESRALIARLFGLGALRFAGRRPERRASAR